MITIALETLVFRREGVSPSLRLLVPAFSLRSTPPWVTPWLQCGYERSPTTHTNVCIRDFGTMLKPRSFSAQGLSTSELLRFL